MGVLRRVYLTLVILGICLRHLEAFVTFSKGSCFARPFDVLYASRPDFDRTSTHRRERKNKYEKFSKVSLSPQDPLEELIADAEKKNRELLEEKSRYEAENTRPQPEIAPLPTLEFPDTKVIDVSIGKDSLEAHQFEILMLITFLGFFSPTIRRPLVISRLRASLVLMV
jgi:hypothetical protein